MKKCKNCGAPNLDDAAACVVCHSSFEVSTPTQAVAAPQKRRGLLALFVAIIVMLLIDFGVTVFIANMLYFSFAESIFLFACCSIVQITIFVIFYFYRQKSYQAAAQQAAADAAAATAAYTSATAENADAKPEPSEFVRALSTGEAAVATATYDENATLANAATLLSIKAGGLEPTSARALLAALAARRMVVLSGKDATDIGSAVAAVTALLGAEIPVVPLTKNCTEPQKLYRDEAVPSAPSPFLLRAFSAALTPHALRTVLLQPEAPEALGSAFSMLTTYLATPTSSSTVTVQHADMYSTDRIALPSNLRILMGYHPGRGKLPAAELVSVGVLVDLKLAKQPVTGTACGAISLNRFLHLVEEAEQQYYIAEDVWKHIDELSQLLKEKTGFVIENKTANAIERFVGVYMAAGGTEGEALDAAIAALVLPAALMSKQLNAEGKEAISAFMDARFGLENLPLCTEALKKLGNV